jgi:uncharacterized protein (TIGR00297 family)
VNPAVLPGYYRFYSLLLVSVAPGVRRLTIAVLITLVFAILARAIRGVSPTGAVAGALVAFTLYLAFGPGAFVALVSVFLLAWLTTRLGYARKEQRGTAEKKDGRTASQVLANLGMAAFASLLYGTTRAPLFIAAAAAALSEAAADTVSSEFGQAYKERAVLITTWEEVPAGTNGGISLPGTIAGILAAAVISLVCLAVGLLTWQWFWIVTLAAVLGMIADSVLGAALERKGILNNDAVNFLSTLIAAGVAALLIKLLH